ncbi:AraC family transcriptional regulator [Ramlibacter sp. 2FC]|uniref:AraC family transcriptional regulator n=1 Tax=Ramlibacter sp. 2FC TaxID=2502188 RepID=UPI00201DE2EC|nr:AraC family transcriptional regulator [Ramlibacter sp. 2FC]
MRLVDVIGRWTVGKEDWPTPIENLLLFRRESPTQPCSCKVEPSLVLVVQGAKQLLVGDSAYAYDPERFLINSLDIPASSQALEASPEKPCLGLGLKLDLRVVADLIAQSGLPPPRQRACEGSSALGTVTSALLEPFTRLLALLDEPAAIPVLAPLIEREIHYRLLMSDQAARLWQIASVGSQSQRIARAIEWLRANYAQPLRIDELAAHVQMSPSNLHHHFRQLTAMSPLQYQKWLRLHEARHLMLNERLDAASAAFQVGYESPSQFSREYSRLFGAPPKRDIEGLRRRTDDANAPLVWASA